MTDVVDEAVSQACREMGAALRRMDDALKGCGVEVHITVARVAGGDWGVFASADVPESIQ